MDYSNFGLDNEADEFNDEENNFFSVIYVAYDFSYFIFINILLLLFYLFKPTGAYRDSIIFLVDSTESMFAKPDDSDATLFQECMNVRNKD